jgi:transposase-like protein
MERRKFSIEFKQQIVRECLETGNISVVARRHDLRPNLVSMCSSSEKLTIPLTEKLTTQA